MPRVRRGHSTSLPPGVPAARGAGALRRARRSPPRARGRTPVQGQSNVLDSVFKVFPRRPTLQAASRSRRTSRPWTGFLPTAPHAPLERRSVVRQAGAPALFDLTRRWLRRRPTTLMTGGRGLRIGSHDAPSAASPTVLVARRPHLLPSWFSTPRTLGGQRRQLFDEIEAVLLQLEDEGRLPRLGGRLDRLKSEVVNELSDGTSTKTRSSRRWSGFGLGSATGYASPRPRSRGDLPAHPPAGGLHGVRRRGLWR